MQAMENDAKKLKGKLSAIKNLKEREADRKALAELIAKNLHPLFEGLANGFALLAEHFEKLEKGVEANKTKFPDVQLINGYVKVANPDDFKVREVSVSNPVKEVVVLNQPDIAGLKSELQRIAQEAFGLAHETNQDQAQGLKNLGALIEKILTKQTDAELLDALKPLRFLSNDPQQPLSVRLSDGEKFYKAMSGIVQSLGQYATNTKKVEDLLQEIVTNTADIEVNIGSATINVQDLEDLNGATLFHDFGEATVPTSTETIIATFTVPATKKGRLKGVQATGDFDAIFRVYVDSVKKWEGRIAHQNRNINANFEIEATASQVIRLKVLHSAGANRDFQGMIYGYIL